MLSPAIGATGFRMENAASPAVPGGTDAPQISVVIPCRNEAANLPELLAEIGDVLAGRGFEAIVVDDGSTDETATVLRRLMGENGWLRAIRAGTGAGQSAAIETGLLAARGEIVVTIDGDGQNDPAYIPRIVDALVAAGPQTAMCAGQRLKRTDTGAKQIASRLANRLRQSMLRDGARDAGCGLKAIRRETFLRLPYFNGWHRYMAALVKRQGKDVIFVDVVDRNRRHGTSKYGIIDRALAGALDLIGVWWLVRRRKRHSQSEELTR